ncbi:hypothetical protein ASALC70_04082 [Alcanivorax sp. ALC70]|nr:hypothetical protein ASALC70_04082 [Alcanivorax sp. ALC70]
MRVLSVLTMDHPVVDLTLRESGVGSLIRVRSFFGFFMLPLQIFVFCMKDRRALINFHYPNYRYLLAVYFLRLSGRKYTVCLWGSDYLKVDGLRAIVLKYICSGAVGISIASPLAAENFAAKYCLSSAKVVVLPFLIPNIEDLYLRVLKKSIPATDRGRRINLLCGTNGSENQQFNKIIEALRLVENKVFDKFVVLFHLGYGAAENVEAEILEFQRNTKFEVRVEKDFLHGEQLLSFRENIDVLIQIQKTDQLSAAMLEHLVLNKLVITGDWLEYSILDHADVFYQKVTRQATSENIAKALEDIAVNGIPDIVDNAKKIVSLFGYKENIVKWKAFLSNGEIKS